VQEHTTIFLRIRGRVAEECERQSPPSSGQVEVNESYFDARRVRRTHHVNGIESFWSYAKSRLHQFHGIDPEKFYLHLKECEYRFNQRRGNQYAELLKLPRKYPL
jgi:transposase-like protein